MILIDFTCLFLACSREVQDWIAAALAREGLRGVEATRLVPSKTTVTPDDVDNRMMRSSDFVVHTPCHVCLWRDSSASSTVGTRRPRPRDGSPLGRGRQQRPRRPGARRTA